MDKALFLASHRREQATPTPFERPAVSVLMLAYNHEKYIRQAIESVIQQVVDFQIELIIGEDFSSDGTRAIAREYEALFPALVRVISSQKNVGMGRNFRRVADACLGDYVAICEGDDYWSDLNKLAKQYRLAESMNNCSFVVHNADIEPFEGKRQRLFSTYSDCSFNVRDVLASSGQFAPTASYFVRREVLQSMPSWIDSAPVIDFFIEAYSQRLGSGHYMRDVMSVYRLGQPNSWTKEVFQNHRRAVEFKRKMVSCYDAMLVDFPGFEGLILARSRAAIREILFVSAILGSTTYQEALDSPLVNRLGALDVQLARLGGVPYRMWYKIRARLALLASSLGMKRL